MQRLKFEDWMRVVDALVQRRLGLACADLDDMNYRDWYNDGLSAVQAARRAARAAQDAMGTW